MRVVCTAVVLVMVVLMPTLALAGPGQWAVGCGPECGHGGLNYEFKGKDFTPTLGAGMSSTVLGLNWYLTDKTKRDMPRGWRVQGLTGYCYSTDGLELALTVGQRIGSWDWGVGVAWFGGDFDEEGGGYTPPVGYPDGADKPAANVGGISVPDSRFMPAVQWAFHF